MDEGPRIPILMMALGFFACCLLGATWLNLWLWMTESGKDFSDLVFGVALAFVYTCIICLTVFLIGRWFLGQVGIYRWYSYAALWVVCAAVPGVILVDGIEHGIDLFLAVALFPGIAAGLLYYRFERPWARFPEQGGAVQ